MKKKSVLLALLVLAITHGVVFVIGGMIGKKAMLEHISLEIEEVNAHIGLSHYSNYRDIALNIKAGHYVDAKCEAEMMATSFRESLDRCITDDRCKNSLEKKAQEIAPEILDGTTVPIEKRNSCSRQDK